MKPNSGLIGTDGYQVCLYPLPILSITQTSGSNSYSHCCGNPFDAVGSTAQAILYAPCDCTLYYQGSDSGGNTCGFTSDKKVITPGGLARVSFQFTHGNLLGNGKTYKQGQPIYTTGVKGMVTGDHVHVDQSLKANAAFIFSGITCSYGNQCWQLEGSVSPTKVFYINDTKVVNSGGLNFQTYKGGIPSGGGSTLEWVIPVIESAPFERSRYLTQEEMDNNAKCFYGYMHLKHKWTVNAVAGVCGNMWVESKINPNVWQNNYRYSNPTDREGFGLVQWTPYTKIMNWMEEKGYWGRFETYGNAECERIQEELETNQQWIPTINFPFSFREFAESTQSPEYLCEAFLKNYERAGVEVLSTRQKWARYYYKLLKGWNPVLPGDADTGGSGSGGESGKKLKWIYYLNNRRW